MEANDIDNLIGKVLANESTTEEQMHVRDWIDLSDTNKIYFEQISTIFNKAAANNVQLQFDTDVAWTKVKEQVRTEKDHSKTRSINSGYGGALRIAAGIIILLTLGILSYRWMNPTIQTFAIASDLTTVNDTLPDGSTTFLNKNSSLAFEYNLREKTRKVKLKGEGFFEVKHQEEKPFVIEAQEVLIRDIGTTFNVKAYTNSDTVEVIVKTGEVQIYTLKNPGLNLVAGETGFYSKRLREFSKMIKADTNALAYKTGIFSFNNTDLQSILDKLNEVYGSHIKLANEKLGHCHITVNFNNEKLEQVVDIIAATLNLTVVRKEKEIILDGRGCE